MPHKIRIPEPCHADWAEMTPQSGGRHCAHCDKVVVDFTGMPRNSILEYLDGTQAQVCGRVRAEEISAAPLPASALFLLPLQRLRTFLIAFVAAFGWQVWGSMPAQAQSQLPENISILDSVPQPASPGVVQGRVLDTYSDTPIGMVRITAMRDGEVGASAYTDEDGWFLLKLSNKFLKGGEYDLQISYMGREREEYNVPADIRHMAITVDLSTIMEDIRITGQVIENNNHGVITGAMVVDEEWVTQGIIRNPYRTSVTTPGSTSDNRTLYRPLDEWLFMNASEIIHSGRH